jgi:5,5'-dehydrodivanillate O-demethylase
LITDSAANHNVYLPSACRDEMLNGMTREALAAHPLLGAYLRDFIGQYGQPDEVRDAYEAAVGQKVNRARFFSVHGARQKDEHETEPS